MPYQLDKPKKTYPPTYKNTGIVPRYQSFNSAPVPTNIIPKVYGKNRNVAGQVVTKVRMKDTKGNEYFYTQTQQLLNLLQGSTGNWFLTGQGGQYEPKRRK